MIVFFNFIYSVYAVENSGFIQDTEMQLPVAVQAAKESVVRIVTSGSQGNGTGFFINPTTVVTNHHVVSAEINRGKDHYIYIENKSIRVKVKKIKTSSVVHDLALLEVEKVDVSPLGMISRNNSKMERIYVVGYPDGKLRVVSGQFQKREDKYILFHTGEKDLSGASGSPLVNAQGKVVGVHSAGLPADNLYKHIGIQVRFLKQLLRSKSFDWYTEQALNLNIQAIRWLQQRAEKGDVRAITWLRETFMSGVLNEMDRNSVNAETRSMYDIENEERKKRKKTGKGEYQNKEDREKEALEINDRMAETEQALIKEQADGEVRRDTYLQVWDWFTGIASKGDSQALGWLGGFLKTSSEVHSWFTEGVRDGSYHVLNWLANETEMGNIKALELLMEGANRGNIQALDRLQKMAARPGDNTYVSEWLRQVANPENIEVMNWLQEEVKQGNTQIQERLESGGNISDFNRLLQIEAEQGNSQALNWLQSMATRGDVEALHWLQEQAQKGNTQVREWLKSEALRGNPIVLYWLEHKGQLGNSSFINALLNSKEVNIYTDRIWQNEQVRNWFKEEAGSRNPLAREWLLQQAIDGSAFALEWLKEEFKQNNVQTWEAIKKMSAAISSRGHNEVVKLLQTEAEVGHIQANELLMEIAKQGHVQVIRWIFKQSEHNFAMYRWLRKEAAKEGTVFHVLTKIRGKKQRTHAQRILQGNTCKKPFQSISQ